MVKIAIILSLLILFSLFVISLISSTWKEEGDEGGFPKILVAVQKLFPTSSFREEWQGCFGRVS